MLLICQQNSSTLPFKMQQDTVGMWAPLTYVMLCWERIPTRIQLNRHLKSKIKSSICHFAVFPQPKVISNCTLPFIPRTSPIQKDQMAPEICLSEILALAVIINMEIERTGQYASKPSTFFIIFTSASAGIASGSLPKTELPPRRVGWKICYHPAFTNPKHLFPCCFPRKNVNLWKNKASINPCCHFEAIQSFLPPLNLFKPTQTST